MNILVTGANGQLGNEMRRVSSTSSNQYIFTDVAELDITSRNAIRRMVNDNHMLSIKWLRRINFIKRVFTISVRKVYVHGMTLQKKSVTWVAMCVIFNLVTAMNFPVRQNVLISLYWIKQWWNLLLESQFPSLQFEEGIEKTVRWYLDNQNWMDHVISGDYQKYYNKMYKE